MGHEMEFRLLVRDDDWRGCICTSLSFEKMHDIPKSIDLINHPF
jgi:CYTH domain-containing protein